MNKPSIWRNLFVLNGPGSCEVPQLIESARESKRAALAGDAAAPLQDKHIVVLCDAGHNGAPALAFESAAAALGAQVARLSPALSRPDGSSRAAEVAGVLGTLYDAIACIGLAPGAVAEIAFHSGVPVMCDWTDAVDAVAGLMTMAEHTRRRMEETTLCLLGDGRSPAGEAWLLAAAASGLELRLAGPREWQPHPNRMRSAIWTAIASGARLRPMEDRIEAEQGADFVYDLRTALDGTGRSGLSIAASAVSSALPLGSEHALNRRYALRALLCACAGERRVCSDDR